MAPTDQTTLEQVKVGCKRKRVTKDEPPAVRGRHVGERGAVAALQAPREATQCVFAIGSAFQRRRKPQRPHDVSNEQLYQGRRPPLQRNRVHHFIGERCVGIQSDFGYGFLPCPLRRWPTAWRGETERVHRLVESIERFEKERAKVNGVAKDWHTGTAMAELLFPSS